MNVAGRMAKMAAHGVTGGVMQELQGGTFGHGFASAAGPELMHPLIGKLPGAPVRTLAASALGGALSHATGGKFANGAVTAAFAWAFNHEAHRGNKSEGRVSVPDEVVVGESGFSTPDAAAKAFWGPLLSAIR